MPEPELMTGQAQAKAYAEADFSAPHNEFVRLLRTSLALPQQAHVADLGCGPGDVTQRVASAFPRWQIDAIDGSPAMIELAERAMFEAGLAARVRHYLLHLPSPPPDGRHYQLLYSNSLLHHLPEPAALWQCVLAWGLPGAPVFIMDLMRPASERTVTELVATYAEGAPPELRLDFQNSLRAAYTPAEVTQQLSVAGLDFTVRVSSDRHLIAYGCLPSRS